MYLKLSSESNVIEISCSDTFFLHLSFPSFSNYQIVNAIACTIELWYGCTWEVAKHEAIAECDSSFLSA